MKRYSKLKLIDPKFNSKLTNLIIDFEILIKKEFIGTTPPILFFQLKELFYSLESIASARIEGNNTTVLDYIQEKHKHEIQNNNLSFKEINNLEKCIAFIHSIDIKQLKFDRAFFSEIHKKVVDGLDVEGSKTPGQYRKQNINIAKSTHIPPDFLQVNCYMEELYDFIERQHEDKYQLLKVALVHHRFTWIHPFDNGNGRTVRLLTYAMLVKMGFISENKNRIINPTAVFCIDRDKYYDALAKADTGEEDGLLYWCEYMIEGLMSKIKKVDMLCNYTYLQCNILAPTILFSYESGFISLQDLQILRLFTTKQSIKALDVSKVIAQSAQSVSRILKNMQARELIIPTKKGGRRYVINFRNNYLINGLIIQLRHQGFLEFN